MLLKRRDFISKSGLLAAGTLMIPRFLQALDAGAPAAPGLKRLVVLQLSGGNDGLNTVVPFRNDLYYKLRPGLAIPAKEALKLTDEAGLHPALSALADCYTRGELSILNSVGYPNPDRSHFRSMDIWHTASGSREYLTTGWLGRYLDACCPGSPNMPRALELDETLSLALKGANQKGLAMRDPSRQSAISQLQSLRALAGHDHPEEPMAAYLYKTLANTLQSADQVYREIRRKAAPEGFPDTEIGHAFRQVAMLMLTDLPTRVYYLSHGSFDTHIAQKGQHQRLFKQLNDALTAFIAFLKKEGLFRDTLILSFSEFGRRVAQNGSGGTDHGAANNMFLIGGSLPRPGLYNSLPDLNDLTDGDLRHTIDFRQVYAAVLDRWLGADAGQILGQRFEGLTVC